jgi:hypothetical protein
MSQTITQTTITDEAIEKLQKLEAAYSGQVFYRSGAEDDRCLMIRGRAALLLKLTTCHRPAMVIGCEGINMFTQDGRTM